MITISALLMLSVTAGAFLLVTWIARRHSSSFYRSIDQPEWDSLLAFIHETTERFLPSPPAEMQQNLFDDPPEDHQSRVDGTKTLAAPTA